MTKRAYELPTSDQPLKKRRVIEFQPITDSPSQANLVITSAAVSAATPTFHIDCDAYPPEVIRPLITESPNLPSPSHTTTLAPTPCLQFSSPAHTPTIPIVCNQSASTPRLSKMHRIVFSAFSAPNPDDPKLISSLAVLRHTPS